MADGSIMTESEVLCSDRHFLLFIGRTGDTIMNFDVNCICLPIACFPNQQIEMKGSCFVCIFQL